jgi:nucleotide-binding universal stress UspA family protein
MLKDILVHIPSDDRTKSVTNYAVSLARSFGANLDGLVRIHQSFNPAGGIAISGIATAIITRFDPDPSMADAIQEQFEDTAKAAGVSYGCKMICRETSVLLRSATELSQLYGLILVAQPDRSQPSNDYPLAESLLLGSGRPLLVIPYIDRGAFAARHIVICWDGGPAAARAVHDAMPFLCKAAAIHILVVDRDKTTAMNTPEALKDHLARRGLSADVHHLFSHTSDIHDVILSFASDVDADMLVMGGYGHSRLREQILGGVTRGVLETMTVPVLFSH